MHPLNKMWKPVHNFPDYIISTKGEVKRKGKDYHNRSPKILKTGIARGYPRVTLYKNRKRKDKSIHILMLEAFKRPRPNGLVGNHKDGNKLNWDLSNLEWITPFENNRHALKTGLIPTGVHSFPSKINKQELWLIRKLINNDLGPTEISKMFKVSRYTIQRIKKGKTYKGD